jgi:hypothetical protein
MPREADLVVALLRKTEGVVSGFPATRFLKLFAVLHLFILEITEYFDLYKL